jgi:hypothetical protein
MASWLARTRLNFSLATNRVLKNKKALLFLPHSTYHCPDPPLARGHRPSLRAAASPCSSARGCRPPCCGTHGRRHPCCSAPLQVPFFPYSGDLLWLLAATTAVTACSSLDALFPHRWTSHPRQDLGRTIWPELHDCVHGRISVNLPQEPAGAAADRRCYVPFSWTSTPVKLQALVWRWWQNRMAELELAMGKKRSRRAAWAPPPTSRDSGK